MEQSVLPVLVIFWSYYMSLSRRGFLFASAAVSSFLAAPNGPWRALRAEDAVTTGANGLYVQNWFEDSFLDLADDHKEARAANKQLVLLFEQAGCPYCKELHRINLQHKKIRPFMNSHFRVVQIDIKGSREVTDFDGEVLSEKAFARKWQIHFTPTLSFFPLEPGKLKGQSGRDLEAFRLTGYWKPFHFETVLHFVHSGSYRDENLQNYLANRLKKMKAQGDNVKVWE